MPCYAKEYANDEKDGGADSGDHPGEDVDHHRNATGGEGERKDTGIAEPVTEVAGEGEEAERAVIPEDTPPDSDHCPPGPPGKCDDEG